MSVARSTGLSDTGRKRRRNEDAFVLAPPLFAVADGMGGAQAGEIASKLAAAALAESDRAGVVGERGVADLIQEANRRVFERAAEDPAASGMGTTVTVALVEEGTVAIGHVGDSRAYLARDGKLEQLTDDHSLVNELMKSGKLSPEEAETHPQRSVITRALGTDPDVDVDTFTIDAQPGDVFLLCSDGLTSMVSDRVILGLLEQHRNDLDRAARALVEAANKGGGEDNITVVAFEIASGSDAAELEETVALPAATPADEEDTLSGLERVPAVDTMIVPPGEAAQLVGERDEAPAPAKERTGRSAHLRLVLTMVLLLAVAAVLVVWGLLH
jgi:PPM family protein phosphatase